MHQTPARRIVTVQRCGHVVIVVGQEWVAVTL